MMKSFSKKVTEVTNFVLKNFYGCDNTDDTDTIVIKRIDFNDDVSLCKQDILNLITNSISSYINFSFNVPIPYDVLDIVDNAFKMETCKVTMSNYDIIFLIDNNMLIYVVKHNNNMNLLSSELVKFLTNLEKNIHHYKILGEYIYVNSDVFSSNILKKQLNVLEIEEETMSTSLKTHNVLTNGVFQIFNMEEDLNDEKLRRCSKHTIRFVFRNNKQTKFSGKTQRLIDGLHVINSGVINLGRIVGNDRIIGKHQYSRSR